MGANLASQVGAFLATAGSVISGTNLYTIFIGGNDVRTAAHTGDETLVTSGVASEFSVLGALIAAGAKNLLVVNVPDVGAIPEFTQGYPSQAAAATQDTLNFNSDLSADVATLRSTNPAINITLFDLYNFQNSLLANPGSLGITNTTDPCYSSYGGVTSSAPLVINAACGLSTLQPVRLPTSATSLFGIRSIRPPRYRRRWVMRWRTRSEPRPPVRCRSHLLGQ